MANASDLKGFLSNPKSLLKEPIFCEETADSVLDLITDQLASLYSENEYFKMNEDEDVQVRNIRGMFSDGVFVRAIDNLCQMLNLNTSIKLHALELYDLFMCHHLTRAFRAARDHYGDQWVHKWTTTMDRMENQLILRMISCIQIAAKIRLNDNNVHLCKLMYVLRRCKQTFSKEHILSSEIRVLKSVNYAINQKTSLDYIETLIEALGRNDPCVHTDNLYEVAVDVIDIFYYNKKRLYVKLRQRLSGKTSETQEADFGSELDEKNLKSQRKSLSSQDSSFGDQNMGFETFVTPEKRSRIQKSNFRIGTPESRCGDLKTPEMKLREKDNRYRTQKKGNQAQECDFKTRGKGVGGRRGSFVAKESSCGAIKTPELGCRCKEKGNKSHQLLFGSPETNFEILTTPEMGSRSQKNDFEDFGSQETGTASVENNDKFWQVIEKDLMFLAVAVISCSAYILNSTGYVRVVKTLLEIVKLPFDLTMNFIIVLVDYALGRS